MWTFSLIPHGSSYGRRVDTHHLLAEGNRAFKETEEAFFHCSLTTLCYTAKVVHVINIICSFLNRIKIEDGKINPTKRSLDWTDDSIDSHASCVVSRTLNIPLWELYLVLLWSYKGLLSCSQNNHEGLLLKQTHTVWYKSKLSCLSNTLFYDLHFGPLSSTWKTQHNFS